MSRDRLWPGVCTAPPAGILLEGLPPPHQLSHLVSWDEKSEEGHGYVAVRQEAETAYTPAAGPHHGETDAAHEVRIRRGHVRGHKKLPRPRKARNKVAYPLFPLPFFFQ